MSIFSGKYFRDALPLIVVILICACIIAGFMIFKKHFASPAGAIQTYVGKHYDVNVLAMVSKDIAKARNKFGDVPKDQEVIRTFGWATPLPFNFPGLPPHLVYELREVSPQDAKLADEKYNKEVPSIFVVVLRGELSSTSPIVVQGQWVHNKEDSSAYLFVVNAPDHSKQGGKRR